MGSGMAAVVVLVVLGLQQLPTIPISALQEPWHMVLLAWL